MALCKQCKGFTHGPLLMEVCQNCLREFLATPIPPVTSSRPSTQPAASHQYPLASGTSVVPQQHIASLPSPNPFHAGENAHARQIARESRSGKSKDTTKATKATFKTITCSLYIFEDGICAQKTGLFPTMITLNLRDPNLYEILCSQLWSQFRPSILQHSEVEPVAEPVRPHISLSQGLARIPSQEILSNIISESTARSKLVIDLMYHHPNNIRIPSKRLASASAIISRKRAQPIDVDALSTSSKRPHLSRTKGATSKSAPQSWAHGGTMASKPPAPGSSLASHMGRLSQRVHGSTIQEEGEWITGNRLTFFTTHPPSNSPPPAIKFQLSNGIHGITSPLVYRVNLNRIIGQGSMRIAYAAEVESPDEEGIATITHWVAKVCLSDTHPSIVKHATDALMYEGFAHLLAQFKSTIANCVPLDAQFKDKAKEMGLVRHAVVANGSLNAPENVYFLEACLPGPYVKYSSNFNFAVTQDQQGMDNQLFQLMNAFTHWTYNESRGKHLVSDLQGVGPQLTDPQIIDMNPHSWSDGNTSRAGIQQFLKEHVCHPGNNVCEALRLGKAVDLKWVKPGAIQHLLESNSLEMSNFYSETC
ncbi:hypothetical protein MJO29_012795 [Puccinia striiformis f. sp. tritici]|uniref:Alpha-type protein kinase domain-containing protein n=1 Tax=Puccinia striiformis f. sp. tritici PST-78 TaxID=1165861 RepID=A0A0L0VSN2_9BASI|nr:hypothetical protein Pst134EA_024245 [Puccinia striiformis f. sp. tritici]KAH9453368.1 hypothetical protein Pst134EA_024245 [Puccinia striiformis f. sp. tritici]KAI7942951.1 hypothetical protein MJO29_012795 [Puccinia striiformis f. sp. tritici]KNF01990.1 hypothetical protein PSTG_04814 [Puccinia striiformis f. sp. tritici PST-78]